MGQWIDTHAHLDLLIDRGIEEGELLKRFEVEGLECVIHVATDIRSGLRGRAFRMGGYGGIVVGTIGIYPSHAKVYNSKMKERLEVELRRGGFVGIGECGIDYYRVGCTKEEQELLFRDQVNLGKEYDLPLVVHSRGEGLENREANADIYKILKEEGSDCGVIHCYSGGIRDMERFMGLGFHIGFGGNVTYRNGGLIRESCMGVDIGRLLLETDSPYLSPFPYRGKVNVPWRVKATGEYISKLRGIDMEFLSGVTVANARKLFRLESGEQ